MGRSNRSGSVRQTSTGPKRSIISIIMFGVAIIAVIGLGIYLLLPPTPPPPTIQAEKINLPVEPISPNALDIYLDMSGSMRGYSTAVDNNTYRDAITCMKSLYGSKNSTIFLGDKVYNGNDLIEDMHLGKLEYKSSSYLNSDINRIIRSVNADTSRLAVFISDGILSGDPAKIKTNPNYTKIHKKELQDSIKEAFSGCKNIHASIYQFIAPFQGEYWDMSNNHRHLNADRYFYVIALGRPQHLADFKAKMSDLQDKRQINIKNQWHAIDQLPLATKVFVTGILPDKNDVYVVSTGTKLTQTADTFGTTKEIIPMYIDTRETFKNHAIEGAFETIADNAEIKINGRTVNLKGEGAPTYDDKLKRIVWYVLKEEIPKQEVVVEILLPIPMPKWIERCTIDDDSNIWSPLADHRGTFLLENFANGIRDGVAANDSVDTKYIYHGKVKLTSK